MPLPMHETVSVRLPGCGAAGCGATACAVFGPSDSRVGPSTGIPVTFRSLCSEFCGALFLNISTPVVSQNNPDNPRCRDREDHMLNEKRAGWKPSFGLPRPGRHQHFLNHNTSLTVLARVTLPHFRARPD